VRICAANVRTRFGRSVLTLLGVVLAVAFLTSVMTTADITDAVIAGGDANTLFDLARATGIDVGSATARETQRQRDYWLISLSILVALVGIINSVLMSVTERFREIGTMKCLGALDSFVVELFILESGLLGVIASFFGWLVGAGGIMLLALGSHSGVLGKVGFLGLLSTFGIAMAVGVALTMIATIAPAIRAAKMPPAMALRVEI